jgi:5-methylcytosine-specific restriction endonuclease McrA
MSHAKDFINSCKKRFLSYIKSEGLVYTTLWSKNDLDEESRRNYSAILSTWNRGASAPSLTAKAINRAATILKTDKNTIASVMLGEPCTILSLINKRKEFQKLDVNEKAARKYHCIPEIRNYYKEKNKRSALKRRKEKLESPHSLSYRQRRALGLVSEDEAKARLIERKTQKRERELEKRRLRRAAEIEELKEKRLIKYGYVTINNEKISIIDIISELRNMREKAEQAINRLTLPSESPTEQWHYDDCKTAKEWGLKFPEKYREYKLLQWQENTEKRRARLLKAGGNGVLMSEFFEIMKSFDYRCAYCGAHRNEIRKRTGFTGVGLEMDHLIPIPVGRHEPENIVPACKSCNTSKSNKDLLAWGKWKSSPFSGRIQMMYNQLSGRGHS